MKTDIETMKRNGEMDYLEWLLNGYRMYKERKKKIMNSLCYYIKKGNNKMISERYKELNNIIDTLRNHEDGIRFMYEKLSGERITSTRKIWIKERNEIIRFLNHYSNKQWLKKN